MKIQLAHYTWIKSVLQEEVGCLDHPGDFIVDNHAAPRGRRPHGWKIQLTIHFEHKKASHLYQGLLQCVMAYHLGEVEAAFVKSDL